MTTKKSNTQKRIALFVRLNWAKIQKVVDSFPGGGSYSMGLRHIIREWQRLVEEEQAGNRTDKTRRQKSIK